MRWSAIDLEAGTWPLKAAGVKSARANLVPLSRIAVELLQALPRVTFTDEGGRRRRANGF